MYSWSYYVLLDMATPFKIFLKSSLKNVPVLGWAMQTAMFVFLDRIKEKDLQRIEHMLSHITRRIDPLSNVLLFPEGTDLSASNVAKSHAFSKQNGLPNFDFVLHPKAGGFAKCAEQLRGGHRVLHDVTIAYDDLRTGGVVPSDGAFMSGQFPSSVHMYVRRHSMEDLPTTDSAALSAWLKESFITKEKLLEQYYSNTGSSDSGSDNNNNKVASLSLFPTKYTRSSAHVALARWLQGPLVVLAYTALEFWLLYRYVWCRWAAAAVVGLFIASPLFDGVDTAELKLNTGS
jgi:hypothetical protein